jgi:signal transduction histidine kinase
VAATTRARDVERARRVERALIWVRWFAVGFGVFQVFEASRIDQTAPGHVEPTGYALTAGLALANAAVVVATRRATRLRDLQVIGRLAFALDLAVTTGFVWNYSYDSENIVWVAAYILPLEGAIRFQLAGALLAFVVFGASEAFRELYVSRVDPDAQYFVASVTFRVGVGFIIGLVAGFMSRSLQREAQKSRDRATLAEEAARRATAARRELAAFHTAILAGVAAVDLQTSLRSMVEAIGQDLGFECLSILLLEDGDLWAKARHGTPPAAWTDRVELGVGVAGRVAATGEPRLEPVPAGGAAAGAPLTVEGEVIGVLEAWNPDPDEIDEDTLDLLVRLADQIALVVHSAELRAHQEETLDRLRELDQMKSDFVAITSHELRTPLTAVRGFVRTMIRNFERLNEKQVHDFLALIDRQSERLSRLVEDLLVVSRIEAGSIAVTPEPVDVRSFVNDVVGGFGSDARRVDVLVDADVPHEVMLDPNRMDQVLSNLLQNAMKFSPGASSVTIGVGWRDGHAEFSVTDRGVGIAQHDLPLIFDRFHQAGPALTRETEGAGLGLYITKRLVDAMEATIEVESREGEGSTFTVRLPVAKEPATTASEAAS